MWGAVHTQDLFTWRTRPVAEGGSGLSRATRQYARANGAICARADHMRRPLIGANSGEQAKYTRHDATRAVLIVCRKMSTIHSRADTRVCCVHGTVQCGQLVAATTRDGRSGGLQRHASARNSASCSAHVSCAALQLQAGAGHERWTVGKHRLLADHCKAATCVSSMVFDRARLLFGTLHHGASVYLSAQTAEGRLDRHRAQ